MLNIHGSMFLSTRTASCRNTKILKNNCLFKRFLATLNDEIENSNHEITKSKKNFGKLLNSSVKNEKIKEANEITAVTVKVGVTCWAKVSINNLEIMEWNFLKHPDDFTKSDEISVMKFACDLKKNIPTSDLYLMENLGARDHGKIINVIRLSSMLLLLLNNYNNDVNECDKIVLQSKSVLNKLYNMSIGNERVSSRTVFEEILSDTNQRENRELSKYKNPTHFSISKMDLKHLEFYDKCSLIQQESLSLVLLMALSFIEVFIYENPISISKFQKQKKFSKIQTEPT